MAMQVAKDSVDVCAIEDPLPGGHEVARAAVGGVEQQPHHGLPAFEISRARTSTGTIQASLMVGLMRDTHLVVFDKCFDEADIQKRQVLKFGPGDVMLFRGDFVHAGRHTKRPITGFILPSL